LTIVGCRLGGREKGIVKCLKGLTSLEELDLRYAKLHHYYRPAGSDVQDEPLNFIILPTPLLPITPHDDGIDSGYSAR